MQREMTVHESEISIEGLNARGEGVCGSLNVPLALPGEAIRAEVSGHRGRLIEILAPSADRVSPFCQYFGVCGGCATQHIGQALYGEWKRASVATALAKAGVEARIGALVDAHGEGRRRVTFHARYPHGAAPELGFMRARAHDIVDILRCPILAPALSGALEAARAATQDLRGLGKPLDIQITATLNGLDMDIRGAGALDIAQMRKLSASALRLDLARIANHGAIVIERRAPEVAFGRARVKLPPGGFLQATLAGEAKLAALTLAALNGAKTVADLFCGAGAFALRLAEAHAVHGVDLESQAVATLQAAARATPGLREVSAEARNLFARPLTAQELNRFDAVVFDPPRAGAEAQAVEMAASKLPLIAAISCNVESFARDARILIDGGFAMGEVTPLDQFRFSPHVELFALFTRRAVRKKRGIFG